MNDQTQHWYEEDDWEYDDSGEEEPEPQSRFSFLQRVQRKHIMVAAGVVVSAATIGWFTADRGTNAIAVQNTSVTSIPQDQISDEQAAINDQPIEQSVEDAPAIEQPTEQAPVIQPQPAGLAANMAGDDLDTVVREFLRFATYLQNNPDPSLVDTIFARASAAEGHFTEHIEALAANPDPSHPEPVVSAVVLEPKAKGSIKAIATATYGDETVEEHLTLIPQGNEWRVSDRIVKPS